MRLYYTANAINLYTKKTGKNLNELANMIGIGYATLNRYSRGERFPDIDILLRICNTLRIRVNNFFIHPDIELTELRIYREEEWGDIHFRHDRIEAVRMEKGYSKTQLVEKINHSGSANITRGTYNNLIIGKHFSYITILGLLEATGMSLDYLFEQDLPAVDEDSIIVSRRILEQKDKRIAELENTVRELELKYKRLEKKALPRYEERMANPDVEKIIKTFIKQAERNLNELKSWVQEEDGAKE